MFYLCKSQPHSPASRARLLTLTVIVSHKHTHDPRSSWSTTDDWQKPKMVLPFMSRSSIVACPQVIPRRTTRTTPKMVLILIRLQCILSSWRWLIFSRGDPTPLHSFNHTSHNATKHPLISDCTHETQFYYILHRYFQLNFPTRCQHHQLLICLHHFTVIPRFYGGQYIERKNRDRSRTQV